MRKPRFRNLGIEELRIEGFEGLGYPMSKQGLDVNRPNEIRCAPVKWLSDLTGQAFVKYASTS